MTLPTGYLPREGDVVILHGVVKYDVNPNEDADSDDGLKVFLRPVGYYADIRVPVSALVGLHHRNWEVGALAMHHGDSVEVLATDGDEVWVKGETGRFCCHANSLDPEQLNIPEVIEPPVAPGGAFSDTPEFDPPRRIDADGKLYGGSNPTAPDEDIAF